MSKEHPVKLVISEKGHIAIITEIQSGLTMLGLIPTPSFGSKKLGYYNYRLFLLALRYYYGNKSPK